MIEGRHPEDGGRPSPLATTLRARLEAARAAHGPDPALVPLDEMADLAASDADDAAHAARLAWIFAHPLMAREYAALRTRVEASRADDEHEMPPPIARTPRRRTGLVWTVAVLVLAVVLLVLRARLGAR